MLDNVGPKKGRFYAGFVTPCSAYRPVYVNVMLKKAKTNTALDIG